MATKNNNKTKKKTAPKKTPSIPSPPKEAPQSLATMMSQLALEHMPKGPSAPPKPKGPQFGALSAAEKHPTYTSAYPYAPSKITKEEKDFMTMHGLTEPEFRAYKQHAQQEAFKHAKPPQHAYSILGEAANWANKNIVGKISPGVSKWIQGGLDKMHEGYESAMLGRRMKPGLLHMLGGAAALPGASIRAASKGVQDVLEQPEVMGTASALTGLAGSLIGMGIGGTIGAAGGGAAGAAAGAPAAIVGAVPGAVAGTAAGGIGGVTIGGAVGGTIGGLAPLGAKYAAYGIHHLTDLSNSLGHIIHAYGTKYSDDN